MSPFLAQVLEACLISVPGTLITVWGMYYAHGKGWLD